MSMVLAVFDDTRAAIASDGHAVQYDGETPFVTRTDCRKIFRTRSGQLVGRVGQSVLCSQLDSILRHFSGSFESCCDVARQFLKDCQPRKGEKPLGALSLIIIGRDSESRVVAFESGRAFDDSIAENVYRCDPGIRGFLAAGLTKNATELDAIVEGLPDASGDFAKFLQTGLQQINAVHPVEVGGDFFAEELDGPSYQVSDGPTYGRTLQTALTSGAVDMSKYGGTGIVGKLPNSTILNDQSSITGNPNAAPSYTSTTTSITWSWGAFNLYFPDGTTISVSSGSASFTGLTASTTYFFEMYVVKATGTMTVVLSDQSSGTAASSLQFQVQTVAADGHAVQFIDITASTPSSGSGGGSGTGGTCFSGDTKIKTDSGFVRMDELPSEFTVINQTGNHRAQLIMHENSTEPMRVMPDGCLVTDEHLFQRDDSTWTPARELFDTIAPQASRTVYNVHVLTENPDDMHYILENGFIAHNKKRVCFGGDTPVRTTHGFIRMDALPEQFEIVNRDGTFPARLIRHEDCKDSMCALPNVGLVSEIHLLRRSGESAWTEAAKMFPASADSPTTLFNIHVDGSDFFELLGSIEANHMRGAQ